MIWLAIAALALLALLPAAYGWLRGGNTRSRREAALALHRAQLTELERDLAAGRLLAPEFAAARLEVERRLLADAALTEPPARRSGKLAAALVAALVPLAAFGLYLAGGRPDLPDAPLAPRIAAARAAAASDDKLIEALRQRLATMDPASPKTWQGYEYLGAAEASRGRTDAAAAAWAHALALKFDPDLAVSAAEATSEAAGGITPQARAWFTRALAEGAPDAKWRDAVKKRLAEAGG